MGSKSPARVWLRAGAAGCVALALVGAARLTAAGSAPGTGGHEGRLTSARSLTLEGARAALEGARAEALRSGGTGAVAVVDAGGALVLLERLDGTFPAAGEVSIGKARSAALFRKPTRAFEESIAGGRTALLGVATLTPLIGGVPIVVDGEVVGAVGVSGAASQQRDEEIALAGAGVFAPTAR